MRKATIKFENVPTDNVGKIEAGEKGYLIIYGVFIKDQYSKEEEPLVFTPFEKQFAGAEMKLSKLRKHAFVGYQKEGMCTLFKN